MAATILGFDFNEMKPQPGLSIVGSENGSFTATHEIVIKASDFADLSANFARGNLLSLVDPSVPSPFDEFLTIDTVTFVRSEGDLISFNVKATGGNAQFENEELAPGVVPTYQLTGQLTNADFSQHRKWKALLDGDKRLLGMLISGLLNYDISDDILYLNNEANAKVGYIDQLDDPDAIQFAIRIQQGQTTYQKSTYTWTETTEGKDQLPPAQIDKLGQISEPRGNPPEPSGDRDWMLTSATQSQTGELYRTTLEWSLSDEGKHDDFLYGEPPTPPP
ncbi:MAG: hypothetical protein ACK48S_03260 [Planctomycetia bacterium]